MYVMVCSSCRGLCRKVPVPLCALGHSQVELNVSSMTSCGTTISQVNTRVPF